MTTLTGRIKSIKQPRGGYIPKAGFVQERYTDATSQRQVLSKRDILTRQNSMKKRTFTARMLE